MGTSHLPAFPDPQTAFSTYPHPLLRLLYRFFIDNMIISKLPPNLPPKKSSLGTFPGWTKLNGQKRLLAVEAVALGEAVTQTTGAGGRSQV